MQRHCGAHLRQVGVHLAVGKPEDGDPEKDTARAETTSNFINPGVVEVVPGRLVVAENRRPDRLPHLAIVPILHVPRSERFCKELEGRSHDATARGSEDVVLLADDQDRESEQKEDGGNQVGQVESNVAFGIDHAELTGQSSDVDEQVKVVVDTGDSDGRVDDDALSISLDNLELVGLKLLNNQRRDVGLEGASSETHYEKTDDEASEATLRAVHDRGDSRDNENDVTDLSDDDRVENCLVTSEVSISDPGSEKGADVDPESVECGEGEGNLLSETEGTGLSVGVTRVHGHTSASESGLGDEVGVNLDTSIVRHALDEFDEGDGVDSPRNGSAYVLKRGKLLRGRKAVVTEVALLEGRLALRDEERWRLIGVECRVLALRITRSVNKSRVQADDLLQTCEHECLRKDGSLCDLLPRHCHQQAW